MGRNRHTYPHLRVISVVLSIVASNTGEASTAWICSVVVPQLRKPCRRPAGTIRDWPAVTMALLLADPHLGPARARTVSTSPRGANKPARRRAGCDPLLEDAELHRAVGPKPPCGSRRLGRHCSARDILGIADFHGNTPFRPPDACGAAKQTLLSPRQDNNIETTLTTDLAMASCNLPGRKSHSSPRRACIGLAAAKRFLAEGWRVALLDIERELLQGAVAALANADHTLALPLRRF